jgi:lipopolysaccharide transport system permease protein
MIESFLDRTMHDKSQPIIISAEGGQRRYWNDLWRYRELLYFLAWRDISVRHKQTLLGVAWILMRPLLTMIVFTVVFGKLANLPSGLVPYPILVFAAMLPWQLFAAAVTESGNSIVNNGSMISKVYFPRMIIPLSAAMVCLVDFLVSAVLLAILMAWYGQTPDWHILTLPLFIALALALSMGVGLWVAALNVKYRDVRFIVSFGIQLGLYVSPVGFSSAVIPDRWRCLYSLNPMVGVIDGFRWALLADGTALYGPGLLVSVLVAFSLLFSAIIHFRKTEKSFADDI